MTSKVDHRSPQPHRSLLEILKALPSNELPNVQTHTKQWIAESDRICTDAFDPSKPLPMDGFRGRDEEFFAALLDDNVLQEMVGSRRIACITRNQLSWSATILFSEDSLEEKWLALSAKEREKHLLSAFRQQEANGADFSLNGQQKLICPELCWDKLVEGNGRGFLDLLMTLMVDNNNDPPNQPLVLEQARFDEIIGWSEKCGPGQKAWLDSRRVSRTQHISKSSPQLTKDNAGIINEVQCHIADLSLPSTKARSWFIRATPLNTQRQRKLCLLPSLWSIF